MWRAGTGLLIVGLSCIGGCKKAEKFPDRPVGYDGTYVLAHRGGRTDTLRENSFPGCRFALSTMDGIEVDVQISKDKTIWLSHSVEVRECDGKTGCFPETRDAEIEAIPECNGTGPMYTRLSEVFRYMSENYPNKYISIDLKRWMPCHVNSIDIPSIMKIEVREIIRLLREYNLLKQAMIESEMPSVLKYASEQEKEVNTYLISYGNLEKDTRAALRNCFTGISLKAGKGDDLDSEKVKFLHLKGLKLMVWNIPDSTHLQKLTLMQADFLQWGLRN